MIIDVIQYAIVAITIAAVAYVIVLPWREIFTDYRIPSQSVREMLLIVSIVIHISIVGIGGTGAIIWAFAGVF